MTTEQMVSEFIENLSKAINATAHRDDLLDAIAAATDIFYDRLDGEMRELRKEIEALNARAKEVTYG